MILKVLLLSILALFFEPEDHAGGCGQIAGAVDGMHAHLQTFAAGAGEDEGSLSRAAIRVALDAKYQIAILHIP